MIRLKFKKFSAIILLFVITLNGCSNSIKPKDIITTDFDLSEAEMIMKRTWKPVNEMTNTNLETKPDMIVSSKEEFFDIYKFTYMEDSLKDSIFETIVDIGENGEVIKDDNGNIVYGKGDFIPYIPTIYDDGVIIKKAYIKESRYKDEYKYLDKVELVIEEESNDKISGWASGFSRTSIFMKDEDEEWILYMFEGTSSYAWER